MQCSRIVIHGSEFGISESTLRRIINDCDIEARNGDLRTAVKMKPRRKKRFTGYKTMKIIKEGHKYEDYLEYMATHDDAVVEMDCVEGKKADNATLLTLHFKAVHFQIAIIMDYHTSECVVKALDKGVLRTLCSRRTTEWKMRGFAAE